MAFISIRPLTASSAATCGRPVCRIHRRHAPRRCRWVSALEGPDRACPSRCQCCGDGATKGLGGPGLSGQPAICGRVAASGHRLRGPLPSAAWAGPSVAAAGPNSVQSTQRPNHRPRNQPIEPAGLNAFKLSKPPAKPRREQRRVALCISKP